MSSVSSPHPPKLGRDLTARLGVGQTHKWHFRLMMLYLLRRFQLVHSKTERSVLALKIGPLRWVNYSPIFESNLAPLNQGQYSPIIARADLVRGLKWALPWAGITSWFELFWPKLCSNGPRKGWIDPLGLKQVFLIFSVHIIVSSTMQEFFHK